VSAPDAWEESLLLVASGEAALTPALEAELRRHPERRAYLEDLRLLFEPGPAPEAPRSAHARALERFEELEPATFWGRWARLALVPALGAAMALLSLGPAPDPGLTAWEAPALELSLQELAWDLEAQDELWAAPGVPRRAPPFEDPALELLLEAESPRDLLVPPEPEELPPEDQELLEEVLPGLEAWGEPAGGPWGDEERLERL